MPKLQDHDNHVIISLVNVRSIAAKMPDIASDNNIKKASILCFCETWLSTYEPSPVVHNNHITIRCDRASGDNKGGVLISMHSWRYATYGLANNTQIQIAVLYRSPRVQFQILTSLLSTLLNHTSMFSLPCIIVGDFNEDILHQTESRIVSFMSTHRYTQLVNTPTTAKGTLIDHIYYYNG